MFFNTLSLRIRQYASALKICVVLLLLTLSQVVNASPGAHGPNGEHLDTSSKVTATANPKFESFTESFELLGELYSSQLVIYLHDFKTNVPIERASIELESAELSATTEYSDTLKAYVLTEQKMLNRLHTEGEHEIVFTVMTEDNGDLLVATLNTINTKGAHAAEEQHIDDHHHLPWFEIFSALAVFIAGFLLGHFKKEKKS